MKLTDEQRDTCAMIDNNISALADLEVAATKKMPKLGVIFAKTKDTLERARALISAPVALDAEVCEDADGTKHVKEVIEHLDDIPTGTRLYAAQQPARASEARFIAEHGHRLAQLLCIDAFDVADRDAQIMAALKNERAPAQPSAARISTIQPSSFADFCARHGAPDDVNREWLWDLIESWNRENARSPADERAAIDLLKRALYVSNEDLPADVRENAETRAAYGNNSAWAGARDSEQRRLINEAITLLEARARSQK